MHIGYCIENFDKHLSVENMKYTVELIESSSIDSIWTTDHIMQKKGSRLPVYDNISESITTLSFIAGMTSRLGLGISTLVLPIRNPVLVAKQLASVDYLSDGRLIPSFSVGWNEDEYKVMNSDFRTRGKRMNEYLQIIHKLWNGNIRHTGEYNFDDITFKPVHKELNNKIFMMAGNSDAAINRAIKYGGWHPAGGISGEEIRVKLEGFDIPTNFKIYARKGIKDENIADVIDEYKAHKIDGVIIDLSRNDEKQRKEKLDELIAML